MKSLIHVLCILVCSTTIWSQTFPCDNTVYGVDIENNLVKISINSSSAVSLVNQFALSKPYYGLGLNPVDNYLYGSDLSSNIVRISTDGEQETVHTISDRTINIQAADIAKDGTWMGIGNSGAITYLVKVNLSTKEENIEIIGNNYNISDFAVDSRGDIYAFDQEASTVLKITGTGVTTTLGTVDPSNTITGLFIDANNDLFGVGKALGGITNAIFRISKASGEIERIATGAPFDILDVAGCPYGISIQNKTSTIETFSCNEVNFSLEINNNTGAIIMGVSLYQDLPNGFTFVGSSEQNIDGDFEIIDNRIEINNIDLKPNRNFIDFTIEISDIGSGRYFNQVILDGLPAQLGETLYSDNPASKPWNDPTVITIIEVEEDSVFESRLICEGEVLKLSTKGYGDVIWENGSSIRDREITQDGLYYFEAGGACNSIYVEYDVAFASCPFTFELGLSIDPDTIFTCNEIVLNYIIRNDSGKKRDSVGVVDTLPAGFKFIRFEKNPFNGIVANENEERLIKMEGMDVPLGFDTVKAVVEVGNVPVGKYNMRGKIFNLPVPIGQFRLSDDPSTPEIDSTGLRVLGADKDTTYVETPLCLETGALLDGSIYGDAFVWFDDANTASKVVFETGQYSVRVRSGCRFITIIFDVFLAPQIAFQTETINTEIKLGNALPLPKYNIDNEADSLRNWVVFRDEEVNVAGISLMRAIRPLEDVTINIMATNGFCIDTLRWNVKVDNQVSVEAPNVMRVGEYLSLYSPFKFGVLGFTVYNRWGVEVYRSSELVLNESFSGWSGTFDGLTLQSGVYIWAAVIILADGSTEVISGDVSVIK